MVLKATLNNISVLSRWSVLLVEETGVPSGKSLTNFITYYCIEYTSPLAGFELIMLVVIDTDWIGGCKSNYHTITMTHSLILVILLCLLWWQFYAMFSTIYLKYTYASTSSIKFTVTSINPTKIIHWNVINYNKNIKSYCTSDRYIKTIII